MSSPINPLVFLPAIVLLHFNLPSACYMVFKGGQFLDEVRVQLVAALPFMVT